jgi:hypothetical protein
MSYLYLEVFRICTIYVSKIFLTQPVAMASKCTEDAKTLKVWWHAATLFVYFIFLLHYMAARIHMIMMKLVGDDLY